MNKMMTTKISTTDKKAAYILILLVFAFVVFTLIQDFLRSDLRNSSFYFSESFMFSSFWWFFAPLLFIQYTAYKHKYYNKLKFYIILTVLPIFIHLFAFPFMVWGISLTFYYHTYSFSDTLIYTLSEHLYLLVLVYSVPSSVINFFKNKATHVLLEAEIQKEHTSNQFINNILVSDGNKKYKVLVAEIFYFSANPPYINIHLQDNKYLHNETLKSISKKLNPDQFVRVHKSTIVNIEMVTHYASRLNGDYDLTMKNNTQLRVSRNFAADFKKRFNKAHHFTTE